MRLPPPVKPHRESNEHHEPMEHRERKGHNTTPTLIANPSVLKQYSNIDIMPLDNIDSLHNEISLHQPSSGTNATDDDVDLIQLKARFEALIPQYGLLWRSMNNKRMINHQRGGDDTVNSSAGRPSTSGKENFNPGVTSMHDTNATRYVRPESGPSFLTAIETKRLVSLRVHDLCDDDCNCANPIVEIDENDSVYHARDSLVDSDDDGEAVVKSTLSDTPYDDVDDVQFEVEFADDESDEDVVVGSKTKPKTLVIESDDESGSNNYEEDSYSLAEQESSTKLNSPGIVDEECIDEDDIVNEIVEKNKNVTSIDASNKAMYSNDNSSASELEWVELSSDEEEEIGKRPNRVNTVVILSSDEEEESESDDQESDRSLYSLGDSDSDSDESEGSIFSVDDSIQSQRDSSPDNKKKVNRTNKDSRPNQTITSTNSKTKPQLTSKSLALAFRKKRDAILTATFSEFNRLAFGNALLPVQVTWSNKLNTTAGITRIKGIRSNTDNKCRVATIELASKVIDNEERLRSTLLHEMCHAAAWLVDGVHKPPHGKCFKKWASISMKKIEDVEVTTTHDYTIAYKFAWACTSTTCNVVIKRHSRSVDPSKHCCGRCKSILIEIEVPVNNNTGVSKMGYTPKQARKTSDYALFVKEQTPLVRQRLAHERNCSSSKISQADVMKECGKMWRSQRNVKGKDSELSNDGLEMMADKLTGMSLNADSP